MVADFIPESEHFFHLDVALGSFVQFVHDARWFFAQTVYKLVGA